MTEFERTMVLPIAKLAAILGEKVTKIHYRPSDRGMIMCAFYRGKTETVRDIRTHLIAKLKTREIRHDALAGGAK